MIANDWRRSGEFFKDPVRAGLEAREAPFTLRQLIAMHALRAIVISLVGYVSYIRLGSTFDASVNSTPENAEIARLTENMVSHLYASPILMTISQTIFSLLITTFFWQVGRVIGRSEIKWLDAQSGFIRFMWVATLISSIPTLLAALFGSSGILLLGSILNIYLFFVFLRVLQGVMELSGFFSAILTMILSLVAVFGVSVLLISALMMIGGGNV